MYKAIAIYGIAIFMPPVYYYITMAWDFSVQSTPGGAE
jgi:hypothetical protein